jgi:RNA polymerase sigma factor (sigma-70 family)
VRLTRAEVAALARANQGLVHQCAKKYMQAGIEFDDLVQEGNLGLVIAAERYDANRGAKFSTYAMHWIRAFISAASRRHLGLTTARHLRVFWHAGHTRRQLRNDGQSYDDAAVAAALGVPLGDLEETLQRRRTPLLRDDLTHVPDVAETPEEAATGRLDAITMRARLRQAMRRLTSREREVIKRRYLEGDDGDTLVAIGESHGCSRERIRQIEARALKKLRRAMRKDGGE